MKKLISLLTVFAMMLFCVVAVAAMSPLQEDVGEQQTKQNFQPLAFAQPKHFSFFVRVFSNAGFDFAQCRCKLVAANFIYDHSPLMSDNLLLARGKLRKCSRPFYIATKYDAAYNLPRFWRAVLPRGCLSCTPMVSIV